MKIKSAIYGSLLILALSGVAFGKTGTISTTKAGTISTTRLGVADSGHFDLIQLLVSALHIW